ncbi:hypothetical protein M422DRAFT_192474, partial [Sphaerobolus stellatus SS14]
KYGAELIKMEAPVMGKEKIDDLTKGDEDGNRVLRKFDALRVFSDDVEATYMGRHSLLGYRANVVKGDLGLIKVEPTPDDGPEVYVAVP